MTYYGLLTLARQCLQPSHLYVEELRGFQRKIWRDESLFLLAILNEHIVQQQKGGRKCQFLLFVSSHHQSF